MDARKGSSLLIALLVGAGVAVSGCNKANSPETVGQKVDKATDKVAAKTESAMAKTAEVVDDAALTTKVKAAIMAEPGLKSLQINVDTKDSVVTLTGTVDSAPMKDKAKEVASSVSGVKSVVDNLTTKAG
jgi:osmotically-inducible protein OsmY